MQEIKISKVNDKFVIDQSFINSFYISDHLFERGIYEVKTLTLGNLLLTLIINGYKKAKWLYIIRPLYYSGFLDTPEGERFSIKQFTVNFIGTLNRRKHHIRNLQLINQNVIRRLQGNAK